MVEMRARQGASGRNGRRVRSLVVFAGALLAAMVATLDAERGWSGIRELVPGSVSARVLAVIDGDTIAVRARIWIGQDVETRVRLAGVDAPELPGTCARESVLAAAARDLLVDKVGGAVVTLTDIRYDKFGGRVLARVETAVGEDLATLLIAAGVGRAYDGGKRASWCDTAGPRR